MNLVFIVYSLKDFPVNRIATILWATCVEFKIAFFSFFLPNIHFVDHKCAVLWPRRKILYDHKRDRKRQYITKLDYIV